MIALELTEVKECMGKLLLSELFDPFYFIEGEIVTFGTFSLDGYLKKDFFDFFCCNLLKSCKSTNFSGFWLRTLFLRPAPLFHKRFAVGGGFDTEAAFSEYIFDLLEDFSVDCHSGTQ
mgnify:CR=1 FL=1